MFFGALPVDTMRIFVFPIVTNGLRHKTSPFFFYYIINLKFCTEGFKKMKNAGILFSLTLGLAFLLNILPQTSYAQVQATEAGMNVAPSVVAEISSYEELDTALETADVILFSVDDAGYVRLSDKQSYSLGELYERCGEIVPAVRVQTEGEADALSAFLLESGAEDFFVLSDSAQMIGGGRGLRGTGAGRIARRKRYP